MKNRLQAPLKLSILFAVFFSLLGSAVIVTPAHAAGICYVNQNASGFNDGTSWTDAYTDLQSALGASPCTDVWVAAGTYYPSVPAASRWATFQLKDGVNLYGGFAGTETLLDERMYMTNVTTLSGAITGAGGSSYHVVTVTGPFTNQPILDGFTITAGNADGTGPTTNGGGGMDVSSSAGPTISNITFVSNSAKNGGGMRIGSSSPILKNVTFISNTATANGGGLFVWSLSSPELTNVTFNDNRAVLGAGFVSTSTGIPVLKNVTFSGNIATFSGGAYFYNSAPGNSIIIQNAIAWGNSPTAQQVVISPGIATIGNSIIEGGCPTNATCTNVTNADPLLGPIGNYGGFTQTIPLLQTTPPTSPAIDISNINCQPTDQRRQSRPQEGNENSIAICDIGAYEYNLVPFVVSIAGSAITSSGATLEGIVNANNASTMVTFEYGLTSSYGSTVTASQSPVTGVPDHFVTAPLSGLTPNTTYHFRLGGLSTNGTTWGSDLSFITSMGIQTISFTSAAPVGAVVGPATYTASATGGASGNPVVLTIDAAAASVCSISIPTRTVSFLTAGTCTINANQAGSTNYNAAAQVQQSFTVGKGTQATLTVVATPSTVPYGSTSALSTTGGSGTGAVTFSAGASTGCSITGSTLSVTNASGSCTVTATKAADANYNAATSAGLSVTLTKINQAALTVVATPSTVPYGSTSALTITGGDGIGAVTYDAGSSTGCSVTGSTLSVTNASGSCTVTATKAADNNYNAATSTGLTVTLTKFDQSTLTAVATPSTVPYGSTSALTITGGNGIGAVTYSAGSSTGCSVTGSTLSVTNASGSCTVTATKAADNNYNAATSTGLPITLTTIDQATLIAVATPSTVPFGTTSALSSTGGSSTGSVTYSAGTSTGCSVTGSTLSVTNASGSCTVTATKAADNNYNAATSMGLTVTLTTIDQATLTAVATPSTVPFGTTSALSSSGGSSTGAVTYSAGASTGCSVTGSTLSVTNASGSCTVTATMAADNNYNAATSSEITITLVKADQSMSFDSTVPASAVVGGTTYTPTATATSGLTVAITTDGAASSVCSISGGVVSFQGLGTCIVNADQAGNSNYNAATQVQQSFTVGIGSQTISFTSTAPSTAVVSGTVYTPTATSTSGLSVTLTIDTTTASVCSISAGDVSFLSAGTCVINANQAGSSNFNAAAQVQQSFTVGKGSQTISFTSTAPNSAVVGGTVYTPAASSTSGLSVTLTIDATTAAVCSISAGDVSFLSAGTCIIDANQAGSSNYNAASQVQQSFTVGKGSQTLSFTSSAPSNAMVGGTAYTPTATSSSGLSVALTIDAAASSVCSISAGDVTFLGVGTCVINANQSGDSNFNAASQVQQSFGVGLGSQTISFTSTTPGSAVVGGSSYTPVATSTSGLSVALTIDAAASSVCSIAAGDISFLGTGTCVINANQAGNGDYNAASQVQQSFAVGLGNQTISYTSTTPGSAVVGGSTYTPIATSTSGLSVTLTIDAAVSSVCSIAAGDVSFLSVGTCVINANQAGNGNYNAANQVQQSFIVGKGSQTISYTSTAPGSAVVAGSAYTAIATSTSGLSVTLTIDAAASSFCSISAGDVSFLSVGTCVINANQAGNGDYNAANQVQQSFVVGKGSQTLSFTSTAPGSATVGGTVYTPSATGGASGNLVVLSIDPAASSVCSMTAGNVSFLGAGTCIINANQAGNGNFNAPTQVQQSFTVGKGSQTLSFTSTAPITAVVGGTTYTPTATTTSGLSAAITIDATATSVCSITAGDVSFLSAGTCVINADQAGNGNFNAATQVQQSFAVGLGSQTLSFTSTTPSSAVVGGTSYTPTASSTSGLSVEITIDTTSTSVCSISAGDVSFLGVGNCTINANQAGNGSYNAATQVQQSFSVGIGSQTISITSTAPASAVVGGTTYNPTAIATSGLSVTITIDDVASTVCSITSGNVSFLSIGTCIINANQAGNSNYNAATQVQQSFSVGLGDQSVSFTSTAPINAGVGGAVYTPTAIATSGLPVTITIDDAAALICSISGGDVSFLIAGTCVINANQAGDSNYNPAIQVQQSFQVNLYLPTITSLSLDIGPTAGGSPVIITGTNLSGGMVTFGGTVASCSVDSDTQITCSAPAHAAGAVDVAVTNPSGTTAHNNLFSYVGASHSISPNFGPIAGGTTIKIIDGTGINFSGATAVSFDGIPATSFTVDSSAQITAVTPALERGTVDIVISTPAGTYYYMASFAYYGADIPMAPVSVPPSGSIITFGKSPTQLQIGFNKAMLHVSASDPDWDSSSINPANYLLVAAGPDGVFGTRTCRDGLRGDDEPVTINSVTDEPDTNSTLNVNNGLPLPVGKFQLLACGTTSIKDLKGVKLNAGLQDTRFTFVITPTPNKPDGGRSSKQGVLPTTGFAPDRVTILPKQNVPYASMNDLWLEIPAISVRMNIVGVPKAGNSWDVSWLGNDAGYLAGSAFPTWVGNSVLTGHVWDARNQPGPFVNLGKLKFGEMIKIHAYGQVYTYEVRENRLVEPENINVVMKHEELSWVTLLTCELYNEDAGSYMYRRMIRAVLVDVK